MGRLPLKPEKKFFDVVKDILFPKTKMKTLCDKCKQKVEKAIEESKLHKIAGFTHSEFKGFIDENVLKEKLGL